MDFESDAYSIWLRLVVAALAVWRSTHLLVRENGPWRIIVRLRQRLAGGIFGELSQCFKCSSLWVALPFVFFIPGDGWQRLIVWLALSGAAILLEEQIQEPLIIETESRNELLRPGSDASSDEPSHEPPGA